MFPGKKMNIYIKELSIWVLSLCSILGDLKTVLFGSVMTEKIFPEEVKFIWVLQNVYRII